MTLFSEKFARAARSLEAGGAKQDRPARQVRLSVARVGVWAVAKTAFLVGVCLAIVTVLAFFVGWSAFQGSGGLAGVASTFSGTTTAEASLAKVVNTSSVMTVAAAFGLLQIVGTVVAGVIGSVVYNLFARFAGGVGLGFGQSS